MSVFLVLQTPVTSAPNPLAICTANVRWYELNTSSPGWNCFTFLPTTSTPGHVPAEHVVLRSGESDGESSGPWSPFHEEDVAGIEGSSVNADEHVVILDHRLVSFLHMARLHAARQTDSA